ncbi:MAG: hypothetical protein JW969_20990 [Spirochaetales bacterium]|nr:hypothetical protein [Spirochaetales bacterium]
MKRTFLLVKASLQGSALFTKYGFRQLRERDLLWVLPFAVAGILLLAGLAVFYLLSIYENLFYIGEQTGHPELLFFYAVSGSWIFVFLTTVPLSLSLFYYAKDSRFLAFLPFSAHEITCSRFIRVCLPVFLINALFLATAVFTFARNSVSSADLFLSGGVHLLTGFLFPASMGLFFVVLLVRIINVSRHKTALEVAGMFFAIAMIIIIQLSVTRSIADPHAMKSADTLSVIRGMFEKLMNTFFLIRWPARSFLAGGIPFLIPSVLVGLASAVLAVGVTGFRFFNDLGRRSESHRTRTAAAKSKGLQHRTKPLSALLKKEYAVLFSNSTFIFQTAGEMLILPLLIVIYAFAIPKEALELIARQLAFGRNAGLVVFAAVTLITSMNSFASCSISREGKSFALSAVLPIPGRTHVTAKLLSQIILYFPVYTVNAVIMVFLLQAPAESLLYIIPGGCLFLVFSFFIQIRGDLKKPVLDWTHPMQAVKNNLNIVAGMGKVFFVILIVGTPCYFIAAFTETDPFFIGTGVGVLSGIGCLILPPRTMRYADTRYEEGMETGYTDSKKSPTR